MRPQPVSITDLLLRYSRSRPLRVGQAPRRSISLRKAVRLGQGQVRDLAGGYAPFSGCILPPAWSLQAQSGSSMRQVLTLHVVLFRAPAVTTLEMVMRLRLGATAEHCFAQWHHRSLRAWPVAVAAPQRRRVISGACGTGITTYLENGGTLENAKVMPRMRPCAPRSSTTV